MEDVIMYLLKSSVILTILYAAYWLMLRESRYFNYNRWTLLSMPLTSLIVPLLSFNVYEKQMIISARNQTTKTISTVAKNPVMVEESINWMEVFYTAITLVYLLGLVFACIKLIIELHKVYIIIKTGERDQTLNYKIIKTDKISDAASFFNYIILPKNEFDTIKVNHEIFHARDMHTIDILLASVAKIILWFHPFIYKLYTDIKTNHEYISDEKTINQIGKTEYLSKLISQVEQIRPYNITNQFSSFIKKRIIMITTNKSHRQWPFLVLAILSIGTLPLFSFKTYVVAVPNVNQAKSLEIDSIKPYKPDPRLMLYDTIVDFDMDTKTETVKVVSAQKSEERLLKQYNKEVIVVDTLADFDYETGIEKIYIIEKKMIEAYNILIQDEYRKPKPVLNKLNEWTEKGTLSENKKLIKIMTPEYNIFIQPSYDKNPLVNALLIGHRESYTLELFEEGSSEKKIHSDIKDSSDVVSFPVNKGKKYKLVMKTINGTKTFDIEI